MWKFVSFDWRYTKHSQTKKEFVQISGQAVRHASQWLKLEHCSSTSWRLHGLILPAGVLNIVLSHPKMVASSGWVFIENFLGHGTLGFIFKSITVDWHF